MRFEDILEKIDPSLIRKASELDDEMIKFVIAVYICDLSRVDGKAKARVTLAKKLFKEKREKEEIIKISRISKSTYYRLKGEHNG